MSINERKDHSGKIKEVDLGLSEAENKALAECRAAVADDAALNDLRDATLARFLRNNSWSVAPALQQLREYLQWRAENKVDQILDNPDFPNKDLIRTIIPYAYHSYDKAGRPVYIEKTGAIATGALADEKLCSMESMLHSHIFGIERLMKLMHESSLQRGERVNGICTILDMTGLGFSHRQCLFVLKHCLDFDKKYYPEYLGKLFVINSPWVAPYIFQAVQVFLDDVTKSRIEVVSGDPGEFLLKHIDAENLPVEYGGKCTGERCNHGGLDLPGLKGCVDELDASKLTAASVSGLDSELVKYAFEKVVSSSADSAGDTFTWYFEVDDDMDVDFSVELLPISGQKEEDESKRVLVEKTQRLKTGKGSFKSPFPNAKLLFRWDNNFSWMASKTVRYSVSCINGSADLVDGLLQHESK